MMPLIYILRKCGYKLPKSQKKINQRMYIDFIKLSAENEKEFENHIQTMRICSQDIGIKFGMYHSYNEKQEMIHKGWNRTTKPKNIRKIGGKETNKYKEILEVDTIKQGKMKKNFFKNLRKTRKLLETQLFC